MNYKILSKILDQLNEEVPDISYIRGMVETLLSMAPEETIVKSQTNFKPTTLNAVNSNPINTQVDIPVGRIPNALGIKSIIESSVVTEN